MPGEKENRWPMIRYERSQGGSEITKSIRVTDCPLRVVIEPWSEGNRVIRSEVQPAKNGQPTASAYPHYTRYAFDAPQSMACVKLHLEPENNDRKR